MIHLLERSYIKEEMDEKGGYMTKKRTMYRSHEAQKKGENFLLFLLLSKTGKSEEKS